MLFLTTSVQHYTVHSSQWNKMGKVNKSIQNGKEKVKLSFKRGMIVRYDSEHENSQEIYKTLLELINSLARSQHTPPILKKIKCI